MHRATNLGYWQIYYHYLGYQMAEKRAAKLTHRTVSKSFLKRHRKERSLDTRRMRKLRGFSVANKKWYLLDKLVLQKESMVEDTLDPFPLFLANDLE